MPNHLDEQLEERVDLLIEAVRNYVGFVAAVDLWRKKEDSNEQYLSRSYAPFQIILRLTAKAVEKEEKKKAAEKKEDRKILPLKHKDLDDLQQYVSSLECVRKNDYQKLEGELGMQRWDILYEAWQHDKKEPNEEKRTIPNSRWVMEIVRYTNNTAQATKWLNVHDENAEVDRTNEKNWKEAQEGFNKRNNSIVILLPANTLLARKAIVPSKSDHPNHPRGGARNRYNTARFGPMITAFLAAMAPKAKGRYLVLRYAVKEMLKLMEKQDLQWHTRITTGEEFLAIPAHLEEWYALHTIRRMYRFRFGISLFPYEEVAGPLDQMRKTQDIGYQTYKKQAKKQMNKLVEDAQ